MEKLLMSILTIGCLVSPIFPNKCKCVPPKQGETTHQGGNELITFRENRTYKLIYGTVRDVNGKPIADVLIEIFDHPEWIVLGYVTSRVKQQRIAACKTGKDGKFCFKNIDFGRYELRASKDVAWNPSYIYLVVNRNNPKSTRAEIPVNLKVGT